MGWGGGVQVLGSQGKLVKSTKVTILKQLIACVLLKCCLRVISFEHEWLLLHNMAIHQLHMTSPIASSQYGVTSTIAINVPVEMKSSFVLMVGALE